MTTLIIARHGNTFENGQTPTRVGARTDLPLVDKGREQARALGQYLKARNLMPDVCYCSTLKRTKETAQIALKEAGLSLPPYPLDIFDEIDYGPDENKPEADVVARLGQAAIDDWDKNAVVPDGWLVKPEQIIENWRSFADSLTKTHDTVTNRVLDVSETILVVTSNGIARFAPHITGDFDGFSQKFSIKLKTGSLGILRYTDDKWVAEGWNIVPLLEKTL